MLREFQNQSENTLCELESESRKAFSSMTKYVSERSKKHVVNGSADRVGYLEIN